MTRQSDLPNGNIREIATDSKYQITLIGYCSAEKEFLVNRLVRKEFSSLSNLMGEYVIIAEKNGECYIITSPHGVCQYYYTVYDNKFFHDDTVIGVLQKSRMPWSWNWKALADLTQLDHVLENDTLHPHIYRVPPASVLYFKKGVLKVSSLSWDELHPSVKADPEDALTALNETVKHWMTDNVVLAMSGGFDSRVILSSLLRTDCRPFLLTMGFNNSTDVVIAKQIASAFDLYLSVIKLDFEDYLRCWDRIVTLTNGTKLVTDWHGYIYGQKARQDLGLESDSILFVGINGEFARSFYLGKALAKNMRIPLSLPYIWRRKLRVILKKEELLGLRTEFASEFTERNQDVRLCAIVALCHNQLFSGLDRFYLEQRVRNFFGGSLKLLTENFSWRVPFLSREWVTAIWNLKRSWKFGSNWHRFTVERNYPRLLNFPEASTGDKMSSKSPFLDWLIGGTKRRATIPYATYRTWLQSDTVSDLILENTALLSELIEANTVMSILREHKTEKSRPHTIAFLLTMLFWLRKLRETYSNDEGSGRGEGKKHENRLGEPANE